MDLFDGHGLTVLTGGGVAGGLYLLARGFGSYRTAIRVSDTATSTIGSIAAGEVRVTGVIEAAELTLVSPLQSIPCVYYRSSVRERSESGAADVGSLDEQAIGFRVRDATGTLRVFPRDARFDAPVRFSGETSLGGDEPDGLDRRQGGSTAAVEIDRDAAVAALLTVHDPAASAPSSALRPAGGRRVYREQRLEPGDPVTIVGRAVPFSDLQDPSGSDLSGGLGASSDDPEIVADLAAARASGTLIENATAAWGNAAIPGFGIGRPVVPAAIDRAAAPLPPGDPDAAARIDRTFTISPETLILAASDEVPLLIAWGAPGAVTRRDQDRFLVGLAGAVLAIVSAMGLALSLGGPGR